MIYTQNLPINHTMHGKYAIPHQLEFAKSFLHLIFVHCSVIHRILSPYLLLSACQRTPC